jgi:hypothetical protein
MQLAERLFPRAGVPEIVNCRSASCITLGLRKTLGFTRCTAIVLAPSTGHLCAFWTYACSPLHHVAAWLQGNAQVTISGTPA